jgi:LysE type translocator
VAVCTMSDLALIAAGVAGFGALITAYPDITTVARFAGAAFLIGSAIFAARRAFRPTVLTPSESAPARLTGVLLTCLAITFLNPHVYLDTVVLLGRVARFDSQRLREGPVAFRCGSGGGQRGVVQHARFRRPRAASAVRSPGRLAHPRRPHRGDHGGSCGRSSDVSRGS